MADNVFEFKPREQNKIPLDPICVELTLLRQQLADVMKKVNSMDFGNCNKNKNVVNK